MVMDEKNGDCENTAAAGGGGGGARGAKPLGEMKRSQKRALLEFRCRMEDAIHGNCPLGKAQPKEFARYRAAVREISLWGAPLLPSKGHPGTDVVLMKFLKATDYKVPNAFRMLRRTLIWRREFKADTIVDERLGSDLQDVVFSKGEDRQGRPLCYNVLGAFKDDAVYETALGSEEKRERFVRLAIQNMEMAVRKLRFGGGGATSVILVTDMRNMPGAENKELRRISKKLMVLVQDYYPDLVYRHIIINVPFWYCTFHALLSRFITQTTINKLLFACPAGVTETLLKFIAVENIPIQYGGLNVENDSEFLPTDKVSEQIIKGGAVQTIEIPITEAGVTAVWEVAVAGWEVGYKEEFVPDDEGSYTVMLKKEKRVSKTVRNSFYIGEPGRIVITIDNGGFKRKKAFYRSMTKPTVPMYVIIKKL